MFAARSHLTTSPIRLDQVIESGLVYRVHPTLTSLATKDLLHASRMIHERHSPLTPRLKLSRSVTPHPLPYVTFCFDRQCTKIESRNLKSSRATSSFRYKKKKMKIHLKPIKLYFWAILTAHHGLEKRDGRCDYCAISRSLLLAMRRL